MASHKTSSSSASASSYPNTGPRPNSDDADTASSFPPPPSTPVRTLPSSASIGSLSQHSQHSHTHSSSSSLNRSTKRRFSSHIIRSNELSATQDKAASENVAPFLAKYSPITYNPETGADDISAVMASNTRYCNRHRPEFKCWRQANEPTMEELQSVSTFFYICHFVVTRLVHMY
jgi:hypothetical protein